MKRKIWELQIGNKTFEGDSPTKYLMLLKRLKKAPKKAHNRRKLQIKG